VRRGGHVAVDGRPVARVVPGQVGRQGQRGRGDAVRVGGRGGTGHGRRFGVAAGRDDDGTAGGQVGRVAVDHDLAAPHRGGVRLGRQGQLLVDRVDHGLPDMGVVGDVPVEVTVEPGTGDLAGDRVVGPGQVVHPGHPEHVLSVRQGQHQQAADLQLRYRAVEVDRAALR